MTRLISPVYSAAPSPVNEAERDELARKLWLSGADLVAIRLSAISDDWTRQAVINEMTRLHGKRKARAKA